jgi:hypothetical protein
MTSKVEMAAAVVAFIAAAFASGTFISIFADVDEDWQKEFKGYGWTAHSWAWLGLASTVACIVLMLVRHQFDSASVQKWLAYASIPIVWVVVFTTVVLIGGLKIVPAHVDKTYADNMSIMWLSWIFAIVTVGVVALDVGGILQLRIDAVRNRNLMSLPLLAYHVSVTILFIGAILLVATHESKGLSFKSAKDAATYRQLGRVGPGGLWISILAEVGVALLHGLYMARGHTGEDFSRVARFFAGLLGSAKYGFVVSTMVYLSFISIKYPGLILLEKKGTDTAIWFILVGIATTYATVVWGRHVHAKPPSGSTRLTVRSFSFMG